MIEEGMKLPSLNLPDEKGTIRDLADLTGTEGLVLYVYPKDDTPGCTVEATNFRDSAADLEALGYKVVGLSKDSATSHCQFIDKYALDFTLLSDEEGRYLERIGAWGEKKMYGRTSIGIIRSTFVVAADGTLRKIYRNVRAKGHAARVLRELKSL